MHEFICVSVFVSMFPLSYAGLPPSPVNSAQPTHSGAANTLSVCSPLSVRPLVVSDVVWNINCGWGGGVL